MNHNIYIIVFSQRVQQIAFKNEFSNITLITKLGMKQYHFERFCGLEFIAVKTKTSQDVENKDNKMNQLELR